MDWKELTASLVGSVAWPAAVVIAIGVFRKQLTALLSEPLQRLKAGPLEMEFRQRTAAIEAELDIADEPAEHSLARLDDIARTSPTAAVLDAHVQVEHEMRLLLERHDALTGDSRSGLRRMADHAHRRNLIDENVLTAIRDMSVLRNLAAHGEQRDLSTDQARQYLRLAAMIIATLRAS